MYKLVQLEEHGVVRNVMKRSEGKSTWPGAKQVWRSGNPTPAGDVMTVDDEPGPIGATPLLEPVMRAGTRVHARRPLDEARTECLRLVGALPLQIRTLNGGGTYPVERSAALVSLVG